MSTGTSIKRTDDPGQRFARSHAEDADGNRDRKLEIVASGGKGHGSGFFIVETDAPGAEERDEEHHQEIDHQRQRDAQHIEGIVPTGDRPASRT